MRSRSRFSSCLALALLLGACSDSGEPASTGQASSSANAKPNLLLITLDTTRVDRLGAYGHSSAQTPNLDSLARDGVRFTRAYAHVPLTLPSHASLLTGTFPPEHGIHDNGRNGLGPELTTLAELFRINGYRTGAFIAAIALDGSFGLDRGFDVYDDHLGEQAPGEPRLIQRRGNAVVDDALSWLNASDQRFFAWVHLYDPHARYEAPADFAMDDPYDAEVSYMDAQIGRLLGWLESRDLDQNTLVVAIADHGESLGDHGEGTHGSFIYQGTQHIPLLVRGPGVEQPGYVAHDLVQQADLLPTLLELYEWPRLAQVSGRSFAACLRAEAAPETTIYLESDYCALNFGWSTLRGVVHGKWKLVQAPKHELYDLEQDPRELDNLAEEHPELVASLEQRLTSLRDSMRKVQAVEAAPSAELSEALAKLGYAQGFGSHSISDVASGVNPLEFIETLELYHEAVGHGHLGQNEQMVAPLEAVVASCPESAGFRAVLGECYSRLGRLDDAARELEYALELDASYDPAYFYLGNVRTRQERYDEAITCFQATLELSPSSLLARRELGRLLWQRGDREPGLEQLELAAEVDGNSARAWLEIANMRAALGRWPAAAEALELATRLTPQDWGLVNFYAWVLATAPDPAARDGARALRLAREMIAAVGEQDSNSLDTLAAAHAESADFTQALVHARRAEELARAAGRLEEAAEIAARVELYAAGKAFRDG